MKRYLLILFTLFLVSNVHAQDKHKGPMIKFATNEWNVGKFSKKRPRRGVAFRFDNTGTADLVIETVDPKCGCLSVEWPNEPIPPGGHGYVTIIYEGGRQLPHFFRKMAVVNSNCESYKYYRLYIEGEMTE